MKGIFYCLLTSAFLFVTLSSPNIKAQMASIISEDDEGITGITSLMNATINNDIQAVQFFSRSGSKSIDKKNIGGATALHIAARNNNLQVASILIENGANVNITDNEGWTPLMRASLSGNSSLIRILLNVGAYATKTNSSGETAIIHATVSDCAECIEQLFSGYDFIKNLNNKSLKSQLNQAIIIAENKNNKQTKLILNNYLDHVLNKEKTLNNNNEEIVYKGSKNKVRGDALNPLDDEKNIQKTNNKTAKNSLGEETNLKRRKFRFSVAEGPQLINKIATRKTTIRMGDIAESEFSVAKIPKKIKYTLQGGSGAIDISNKKVWKENIKKKDLGEIKHQKTQPQIIDFASEDSKTMDESMKRGRKISSDAQNIKPIKITKSKKKYIFLGDKKPFKPFKKNKITSDKVIAPKKQDRVIVKKPFVKKDPQRIVKNNNIRSSNRGSGYQPSARYDLRTKYTENQESNINITNIQSSTKQTQIDPKIKKIKYKFLGQKKSFIPLYKK